MTFDRIAGDKIYDDSGYGNIGHLNGMAKLARDVGKCGHGLRFQGGKVTLKRRIFIEPWIFFSFYKRVGANK